MTSVFKYRQNCSWNSVYLYQYILIGFPFEFLQGLCSDIASDFLKLHLRSMHTVSIKYITGSFVLNSYNDTWYSQTRIKCSRPISSLRGLQGHKIFADAIIKILIATKSIIGKNCHDQLFINEVVKNFHFSIWRKRHKILCSKSFIDFDEIFHRLWSNIIKFFWWEQTKNLLQWIFQQEEKTEKWQFLASIT